MTRLKAKTSTAAATATAPARSTGSGSGVTTAYDVGDAESGIRGFPRPPGRRNEDNDGGGGDNNNNNNNNDNNMPVVDGESFTVRGVLVGLAVGTVICFSNMYFGLQTGWVSIMSMPASLLGFGIFSTLLRGGHVRLPFSPVENVLVQSVAGGMAIMPLGCGFVGVVPAMDRLLRHDEGGPFVLGPGRSVVWALGLCYFGVVFAVPLRRQVLIREKLRFPSGFSTAVLISVMHGRTAALAPSSSSSSSQVPDGFASLAGPAPTEAGTTTRGTEWKRSLRLLSACFAASGSLAVATYFVPALGDVPLFGHAAAATWLWTLNPSLAYVGQGIIMGPETTAHMVVGTVVGWGLLSPLAKTRGWAPGSVDSWEDGAKGWILWVALAIMLVDALVNLGWVAWRQLVVWGADEKLWRRRGYMLVDGTDNHEVGDGGDDGANGRDDAPEHQQVNNGVVVVGLVVSVVFCVLCVRFVFGAVVGLGASVFAVLVALVLSVMGVRALGETDLNPVSGISKLAQLVFALVMPQSNRLSVLANLVAGAISEAGALQAGDLMQDLKTGHLLGAAPKAQFYGQLIGATVGAVASAFIYRLYTSTYEIPSKHFPVPTAYVWIFTARLVTGRGLPPHVAFFAVAAALLFAVLTGLRIYGVGRPWRVLVPGGIAVAIGMFNVPSFTLARAVGGLVAWAWRRNGGAESPLVVLASGLVLGEGCMSIVNLVMASLGVPHL